MLVMTGIGVLWLAGCVLAICLCVAARLGDAAMTSPATSMLDGAQSVEFGVAVGEPDALDHPVLARLN